MMRGAEALLKRGRNSVILARMRRDRGSTALPRVLLGVLAVLCLGGCGFTPLYGTSQKAGAAAETQVQERLLKTEIGRISGRQGQILRNLIVDRVHPESPAHDAEYILRIDSVTDEKTELGIKPSGEATRRRIRLDADMRLVRRETDQVVLSRNLRAFAIHNVLGSQFATRTAREEAVRQALQEMADQALREIVLYFRSDER